MGKSHGHIFIWATILCALWGIQDGECGGWFYVLRAKGWPDSRPSFSARCAQRLSQEETSIWFSRSSEEYHSDVHTASSSPWGPKNKKGRGRSKCLSLLGLELPCSCDEEKETWQVVRVGTSKTNLVCPGQEPAMSLILWLFCPGWKCQTWFGRRHWFGSCPRLFMYLFTLSSIV